MSVHQLADARRAREAGSDREPWATKQQLAAHLGFSTRWVEQQVALGCPSEKWGGQRRFRVTDVENWLRRKAG